MSTFHNFVVWKTERLSCLHITGRCISHQSLRLSHTSRPTITSASHQTHLDQFLLTHMLTLMKHKYSSYDCPRCPHPLNSLLIDPRGLPPERQWYLYDHIREFCPEYAKDIVAPVPTVPKPDSSRPPDTWRSDYPTPPVTKRKRRQAQ